MSTICASATAPGGAIGIIRISGPDAIRIANSVFSRDILSASGYSMHYGHVVSLTQEELTKSGCDMSSAVIDDVILSICRAPHSYTGEDTVEISHHGSSYIQKRILELLVQKGCVMAQPGEFTQRAFLNGKMDLSQAEAVADLIASQNEATHRVAMKQMRGAIAQKLNVLRDQLLTITSLLELELDFSEEDVEFADRQQLLKLSQETKTEIDHLSNSFTSGNAIKNGIPVAIVGAPNVGKSTLLNYLLKDDRAIVSDIEGTTRDLIEDTITLGGFLFRFIDTAGIRNTNDTIERLGIERSIKAAQKAQIIILLTEEGVPYPIIEVSADQHIICVNNKIDRKAEQQIEEHSPSLFVSNESPVHQLSISAITGYGVDSLEQSLIDLAKLICGDHNTDQVLITNLRHKEALDLASCDIQRAIDSLRLGISGDLIAEDLRLCISHLSTILGTEITTDEVLANIFKNFCIGK